MRTNNENTKWYILIAVALLVGAIIGYFATANLITTGNAKTILENKNRTPYEAYAIKEINQYIKQNNLDRSKVLVVRESTDGELRSGNIIHYSLDKYNYKFSTNAIVLTDKETGVTILVDAWDCQHVEINGNDYHYHAVFPADGGVEFGYFRVL